MIKFILHLHGIRDTMMAKNEPHPLETDSQSTRGDMAKEVQPKVRCTGIRHVLQEENRSGYLLAKA